MSLIIGRKPVLEALNSEEEIEVVYVAFGMHGDIINQIGKAAKERKIKLSQISPAKLDEMAQGKVSQGVAALKSVQRYYDYDEIVKSAKANKYPLILILDSIQDPHNLGAILRTAECAAADGIFITQRDSSSITDTVVKTSAGAVAHLKICKISNVNLLIRDLKKDGFWVFGTSLHNSKDYTEVDFKCPVALILGNEEKGIHKLVADNCDQLIKIPMLGKIDSLNVSVSAGVILFEIVRQQRN
jgi:23S rRNA (guanosine2251-2'-O)-methyltransferase